MAKWRERFGALMWWKRIGVVLALLLVWGLLVPNRRATAQNEVPLTVVTQGFETYEHSTSDDSITVYAILRNDSSHYLGNIEAKTEARWLDTPIATDKDRPLKWRLAPGEETFLYNVMYDPIGSLTDEVMVSGGGFTISESEYDYAAAPSIASEWSGSGSWSGLRWGEMINNTGMAIDNEYCFSGCDDFKYWAVSLRGRQIVDADSGYLSPTMPTSAWCADSLPASG